MAFRQHDTRDLGDIALAERDLAQRQRDLTQIPEQVSILARAYRRAGGDPHALLRAVAEAPGS